MNDILYDQLKKCKVANIPEFDKFSIKLVIPKGSKVETKKDIEINHYYKIEVEDYIINPYDGFNLHDN